MRPRRQGLWLPCGPSTSPSGVVLSPAETALAAFIYAAFSSAQKPKRDVITPHRCPECDDITAKLAPYEAAHVPDAEMQGLGQGLAFLGPEAFRHYLPRFIEFSMAYPDSDAARYIVYNLVPDPDLDVGPRNRFQFFSTEERKALRKFIEHRGSSEDPYLDENAVKQALEASAHDV